MQPQREETRLVPGWPNCALDTALLRASDHVRRFHFETAGGDEAAAGRHPAEVGPVAEADQGGAGETDGALAEHAVVVGEPPEDRVERGG